MSIEPKVRMRGISKTFRENGVTANKNVSFDAYSGEIHCILGENGTGKSTLMHILSGLVQRDGGTIFIDGKEIIIRSPHEARMLSIGMVHQKPKMIPSLTVWENIVLGDEPLRMGLFLSKREAEARIIPLAERYGIRVSLEQRVGELPLNLLQRAAILSLLYQDASILIFDEPTLPFTEEESSQFYSVLHKLAAEGKTIIVVSHRIGEVLSFADRITVMRDGEAVYTAKASDIDRKALASFMVGTDSEETSRGRAATGEILLELKEITASQRHSLGIKNISFAVRRGEIVSVTGIRENGLEILEDVIAGGIKPKSGQILYRGKEISNFDAYTLRELSVGYVPKDRMGKGICPEATAGENIALIHTERFSCGPILTRGMIEKEADTLLTTFAVRGKARDRISSLSGGNIQKLILSRELSSGGDLFIISEPAWGLDAAGRNFVYNRLCSMRSTGKGILIFSVDIDEVLSVSDRIIILYNGKITATLENRGLTRSLIGEYLLGLKGENPQ